MQENLPLGFAFVLIAGIFAGSFALPMKFTINWKWQHNWMVFVTWAMLIMPAIFAIITIPHLMAIYQVADNAIIFKVFLYGLAWGVGVICYGLGLNYLGIGLAMSIMLGLTISIGALLPIVMYQSEALFSPEGIDIIIASIIILAGIIVCAIAGSMRDKRINTVTPGRDKSKFKIGVVIAIFAGILSPMQNIGFVTGNPIQTIAVNSGANPVFAGNAVWPVIMAGCFIINLLYCGFLVSRHKEWSLFKTEKKWYWPAIAISGISWFLCMLFFGMAASKLGKLGPSIGWASFQTLAIITGNFVGLFTGEWKNSGTLPLVVNFVGIAFLVSGIAIIAF